MAEKLLADGDRETGLAEGAEHLADRPVIEGRGVPSPLPRMGDDRDFLWHAVAVDPAELQLAALVPPPVRLLRDAETRVHEDRDEAAAGLQGVGGLARHRREVRHVVDGHDAGGGVIRAIGPGPGRAGVGDDQVDPLVIPEAFLGGLDQLRAGIDAGDMGRLRFQQQRDQHALAAAEIEEFFARLRSEQTHRGRQDDIAVVVRALVTDELVIPARHLVPALLATALGGRRTGALPSFLGLEIRAFSGISHEIVRVRAALPARGRGSGRRRVRVRRRRAGLGRSG